MNQADEMKNIEDDFNESYQKVIVELAKIGIQVDRTKEANELYMKVYTKISAVGFDVERIDNYTGAYGRDYLKKSFLRSLNEIKKLNAEYGEEYNLSLAQAVGIFLNAAKINLIKPLNEYNQARLDHAIVALKIFRSMESFENEYLDKLEGLNSIK